MIIETKRCRICSTEKNVDDFHKGNGKQGRAFSCKTCHKQYLKNYQRKIRQEAIDAYGGKCACCGEIETYFLAIDHVFGNANKEEGKKRGGYNFYLRLKRLNYPQGKYRVLCHNCNMGRECNGGICPHVKPFSREIDTVWIRSRDTDTWTTDEHLEVV